MSTDIRKGAHLWIAAAEKQGFTIKQKKNGVMVCKGQHSVMIHRTCSDVRALKNVRAQLRRIGVDC